MRAPALLALALLAFGAPLLASCRTERPLLRIGLVVPLSGRDASMGENILAAARHAVAEANEESQGQGPRFALAAEDEATVRESLVTQARKLAADQQNIGVVGYLSEANVAAPIFSAADLPFLVLGTGSLPPPALSSQAPRLRLAPPEAAFVETATRLVAERVGARRVDMVLVTPDLDNRLSRVAESLRAAGVSVEPQATMPAALRLAPPPDAILVAGPAVAAAEALLELRSRGYSGTLVCVDGCDSPDFLKVAGDQAAGVTYLAAAPAPRDRTLDGPTLADTQSTPALPGRAEPTGPFSDGETTDPASSLSRAAIEAWPWAALAYDGIHLLASAARQSGPAPTRQGVAQALLASQAPIPGATGPLLWDQRGERRGLAPAIYEYTELRYPARLVRWPPGTPVR